MPTVQALVTTDEILETLYVTSNLRFGFYPAGIMGSMYPWALLPKKTFDEIWESGGQGEVAYAGMCFSLHMRSVRGW